MKFKWLFSTSLTFLCYYIHIFYSRSLPTYNPSTIGVFSLLFLFNYLWLLNANIIDFDCVYVQRSVNWPRHTVLVNIFFTESKQNHSSEVRLRWTIVNPGTEKSTLSYLTYNVEIKPWTTGSQCTSHNNWLRTK